MGNKSSLPLPHFTTVLCLLVVACCSTTCLSFTTPNQTTQPQLSSILLQSERQRRGATGRPRNIPTSLFSAATITNGETAIINESVEENVSSSKNDKNKNNSEINCVIPKGIVDDDFDELSSSSSPVKTAAFKDAAESPAPPLSYQKYMTMQKKRVPVTIRYSAESGLKPYYLTVAKRVKDLYPDVLIEVSEFKDDAKKQVEGGPEGENAGSFEVAVDGRIIVRRANQKAGVRAGSIFVSMAEMDLAITRARKRRRPSTVYGEDGKLIVGKANGSGEIQDESVKSSRLEVLKQKATELQRDSNDFGSKKATAKSN